LKLKKIVHHSHTDNTITNNYYGVTIENTDVSAEKLCKLTVIVPNTKCQKRFAHTSRSVTREKYESVESARREDALNAHRRCYR